MLHPIVLITLVVAGVMGSWGTVATPMTKHLVDKATAVMVNSYKQ